MLTNFRITVSKYAKNTENVSNSKLNWYKLSDVSFLFKSSPNKTIKIMF